MAEKSIVMSLSMPPKTKGLINSSAQRKGCSASELVRTLVEKCLPLVVNDGQEIPVLLKIPSDIRGDRDKLRAWLQIRMDGIVNKLS